MAAAAAALARPPLAAAWVGSHSTTARYKVGTGQVDMVKQKKMELAVTESTISGFLGADDKTSSCSPSSRLLRIQIRSSLSIICPFVHPFHVFAL